MANAFLTPDHISKEALRHLENELVFGNLVHTDYSKEFNKVGDTISIRRPAQYLGQFNNLDITSYNEDIQQATIPLVLDQTATVAVEIGALERTLSFDRFSEDVLKPAMITMRDKIESDIAALYYKFYHFAGTPGTVPATFKALGTPATIMTNGGVPMSGRVAVHDPNATLELASSLTGSFVREKAKKALEEASFGRYAGFDNYESVSAPTHTVGVATGTPLVNGASQGVTYADSKATWSQTLATNGWTISTTGILKKGDVITIAGVYAVNPVSKKSTGRLQDFTVLADANSGGSGGPADLTISPPMITTGAFQTVSAAPADDAEITVRTGTGGVSYRNSMLFHPKAIALVSRPLDIQQVGVKTSTRSGNKVTISVTEFMDYNTLAHKFRFDMLYKPEVIDPRLGARLTS